MAHLFNQNPVEAKRAAEYAHTADPRDPITPRVIELIDSVLAGKRPCPHTRKRSPHNKRSDAAAACFDRDCPDISARWRRSRCSREFTGLPFFSPREISKQSKQRSHDVLFPPRSVRFFHRPAAELPVAGRGNHRHAVLQRRLRVDGRGLALTAVVAYWVAHNAGRGVLNMGTFLVLFLVQIVLVSVISGAINRINAAVATGLFLLDRRRLGVTLSVLFLAYTLPTLGGTFLVTAGTFGAMSLYGYVTKRDLTRLGSLLFMALIGLILASVVNVFWANSGLYWSSPTPAC